MVAIKESSEQHQGASLALGNDDCLEEAVEILNKSRAILKKRLSFFVWQGFFEPLTAISLKDQCLSLDAPTSFHRNWVMDHYMPELIASVLEASGQDIKVVISNSSDGKKRDLRPKKVEAEPLPLIKKIESNEANVELNQTQTEQEQGASVINIAKAALVPDASMLPIVAAGNLNHSYNFETFIQGPSNQMGYAAAMAVADHPGTQYSPLFIFGGVGLGKTHLLHAIGLRIKSRNPTLRVMYLSCEQWVNSYIQAIKERQFDSFRNRFRNSCDILLMDDIQFLAGKDASQDEFFHTFNCLHDAKKQIVVSSDKYPHEIDGLEERLQTRLSWGLIADIRPPEIETRIAILHKKAEGLGANLSDEVLHFLASSVTSSVRELEGALVRLAACSSLTSTAMTMAKAKEYLTPMLKKKNVIVSWQKICEVVSSYYGLRTADLVGKSRQKQVVFARQVAMSFCRSMLSMSLPEIGRAFGGRDHSTVISSLRKMEEHKRKDMSLETALSRIEDKVVMLANN